MRFLDFAQPERGDGRLGRDAASSDAALVVVRKWRVTVFLDRGQNYPMAITGQPRGRQGHRGFRAGEGAHDLQGWPRLRNRVQRRSLPANPHTCHEAGGSPT